MIDITTLQVGQEANVITRASLFAPDIKEFGWNVTKIAKTTVTVAKEGVERKFKVKNGHEANRSFINGDTSPIWMMA